MRDVSSGFTILETSKDAEVWQMGLPAYDATMKFDESVLPIAVQAIYLEDCGRYHYVFLQEKDAQEIVDELNKASERV